MNFLKQRLIDRINLKQKGRQTHINYRLDIDGLRAIAVLAVVAFHVFPNWVKGGFIGVDIFFVISGYLISTIIFEGLDKGSFSFSEFYARRIKRIFPALTLVLVTCFIFGWFALLADEYKQLGKHIAAGAGFISNIIFWNEAGYFDNAADTKPLLHLWSLGIEEQFYIVWPLLLWLAWRRKFNLLTITIVITFFSFALNLKGIKEDAVATFYSPQTRFWELLSGSLLAWVTLYKKDLLTNIKCKINIVFLYIGWGEKQEADGKRLANFLSFAGLFLLLYGFWRINKELIFPGEWALIPIAGTTLIIMAGSGGWVNRKILSNKIAVWFGLISFPLYLWHWPVLSFARIVEGEVPIALGIGAVVLSVVLAWLTYRLVECPIRFGNHGKAKVTGLVIIMAVVGYVGYYTYKSDGLTFRNIVKHNEMLSVAFKIPEKLGAIRENCEILLPDTYDGHCLVSNDSSVSTKYKIIFIGDSESDALSLNASALNKQFISLGKSGCLPFIGVDRFILNNSHRCSISTFFSYKLVKEKSLPDSTVVITAWFPSYHDGVSYKNAYNFSPENLHIQKSSFGTHLNLSESRQKVFFEGLKSTLDFLSATGKKVVIVLQVPELSFDPKNCLNIRPFKSSQINCYELRSDVLKRQHSYRESIEKVTSNFANIKIFDPINVLCGNEICSPIYDGLMIYRDFAHINGFGSAVLLRAMQTQGYLD